MDILANSEVAVPALFSWLQVERCLLLTQCPCKKLGLLEPLSISSLTAIPEQARDMAGDTREADTDICHIPHRGTLQQERLAQFFLLSELRAHISTGTVSYRKSQIGISAGITSQYLLKGGDSEFELSFSWLCCP